MATQTGLLEGYLTLRPSGKFGLLKTKKRQWYAFDEQNQQLLCYPNRLEVGKQPPSGSIPLKNVAISLVLDEVNSFVLHTDGKDYTFSTDNHKSMLDWICTLQLKRDNSTNRFLGQESVKELREKYLSDHHSYLRSKIHMTVGNTEEAEKPKTKIPLKRTQSLQVSQSSNSIMPLRKMESSPGKIFTKDVTGDTPPQADSNNNEEESQFNLKIPNKTNESEESEYFDENYASCVTSPMTSSEENHEEKFVVLRHLNYAQKHKELKGSTATRKDSSDESVLKNSRNYNLKRIRQLETELMEVKCQLAKAVNRTTIYKNKVLSQEKDLQYLRVMISEMTTDQMTETSHTVESSDILETHNRFLNEEVIKLSRQIQEQEYRYQTQQFQAKEMEADLEQLKRDYVFLMQSAMRPASQEGPEKMEVYLYGGSQHKSRVIQLLNEARSTNPTLPVYDNSCSCLCHVDSMGFQHCYTEEQVILHYLCRQLYHHYNTRVRSYQLHQLRWKEYLKRHGIVLKPTKELKELVRGGIPNPLRSRVWCYLYRYRVKALMDKSGQHYYNNLCSLAPDSKIVAQNKRQISLDLLRTLPNNIRFSHTNGDGVRRMQEILQSFCIHDPELGYCQGMNFLVAICLLFMDAENSFWCLVAIVEHYFPSGYYDCNLIGAQVDQEVLKDLMREKTPAVYQHLESFDIEICTVTLNWFLAIFFDSVPIETVLRIWDCFLLEGPKVIFRFALAIIKIHESAILAKKDAVSVMRQMKTAAKLCYDADDLMKVAYEDLKPFPCRKDIAAKQSYYLKSISERILRQQRERDSRTAHNAVVEKENGDSNNLFIECAGLYDADKILICYGTRIQTKVAKVNCEENIMYDLQIKFDSRIKCMHVPNESWVLFGSISSQVYAYSNKTRKCVWEVSLNDSVLCLSSLDENGLVRVFAGLADGTVAVIQNYKDITKPETFYVSVGSSPVTCLCLVNGKLWCATGNRIIVLSLKTFDTEDNFQTSANGMDYVSLVVLGSSGVWVTLRGSSVLQLWDHQDMSCRLLFDVAGNHITKNNHSDLYNGDTAFTVSSLLQVNGCVIVGTDEGSLFFYDVIPLLSRSCSTAYSPGTARSIEDSNVVANQNEQDSNVDVLNEIPFFRERNDSGCYSSTTTTLTLSRRESSTGGTSDKAEFEVCYTTLEEQNDNSPSEQCKVNSVRTSSEVSTAIDSGILSSDNNLDPSNADTTRTAFLQLINRDLKTSNASETSDSEANQTSFRKRHAFTFNRHLYTLTALSSKSTLEGLSSKNSRSSSMQTNRFSRLVAELHELKRRLKRKSKDRCLSMPDLRQILNRKPSLNKLKSTSVDGVLHYASAETLCSITTWDSYEYDDLFVAYTDDEFGKFSVGTQRTSSTELRDNTNLLLDSLKLLDKNNAFGVSNDDTEICNTSTGDTIKDAATVIINVNEVQSQEENSTLRHNKSWTSCDGSKRSSSTNGDSHDESTSAAEYPARGRLPISDTHLDFLHLQDWTNGFSNGQKGGSSDTASVMSSVSTDQAYTLDLVLVEKIKISDKPIKCLLKTKCSEELTVVSCSGCYDDDEAILKWTREGQDKLWTNDPVVEVCPYTNKMRPSRFVRSRLPRRASINICSTSKDAPVEQVKPLQKEPAKRVKSEPEIRTRSTRSASASQILHSIFSYKSSNEKK